MKKKLIVVIIILLLIAVLVTLFFFFDKKNDAKNPSKDVVENMADQELQVVEEPRFLDDRMKQKFLIATSTEVRILSAKEKQDYGIDSEYDVHEMTPEEKDYLGIDQNVRSFMDLVPPEDSELGTLRRTYFCQTDACGGKPVEKTVEEDTTSDQSAEEINIAVQASTTENIDIEKAE